MEYIDTLVLSVKKKQLTEAEAHRPSRTAATETGMPFKVLDEHVDTTSGHLSISTMHLAKGLEFRAVVVRFAGCLRY
jgi:superfamily I DNA/RNA helicase